MAGKRTGTQKAANDRGLKGTLESWVDFKTIEKIDGLLCSKRKLKKNGIRMQQFNVAETRIPNILFLVYESPCTGLHGIEKKESRGPQAFFLAWQET